MNPSSQPSRNVVVATILTLILLAVFLPWALSRMLPQGPDDPEALLQQAMMPGTTPNPPGPAITGTVVPKSVTINGEKIEGPSPVTLGTVEGKSGVVGFAPRLSQPLKPGEKLTIELPDGGGRIEMRTVGEPFVPPDAVFVPAKPKE
jgi:hypothetical protein